MIGFLAPWFLLAGGAILVPLALHSFSRREGRTFSFPAIRYLLRNEKERARRIRSEQLLLLLLRIAVVVTLVLLGARLHFAGDGRSHEPTALAIVMDNSMSASVVEGGRRRLDAIKAAARASVAAASHDDAVWVLRAGTPWVPAMRGGAAAALEVVAGTQPSHGPADLAEAVRRARAIVGQSGLPAREVHLLTDMQASGLAGPLGADDAQSGIPVVVFAAPGGDVRNLGVESVAFDGGLRPLAGRRTDVAVAVTGNSATATDDAVGVRLHAGGRVRGATAGFPGATVRLSAGPFAERLDGYVEIDADALAADDRRFFALHVRDATPVGVAGPASFFLTEALSVMEEHGRVVRVPVRAAAVLFSTAGEGLGQRNGSQAAVVLPGADPALLPALNRRLAEAGIPFSYEGAEIGGARLAAGSAPTAAGGWPAALDDAEVSKFHRIAPLAAGSRPGRALLSLSSGDPWLIEGRTDSVPFMLVASPLDLEATSVPVSAAMIPLLEWIVNRAGGSDPVSAVEAGSPFPVPAGASRVRGPDSAEHVVDAGQPFFDTRLAGFYEILAGDSVIDVVAVNAPVSEMDLTRASGAELRNAISGVADVAEDLPSWREAIFRARRGSEPWRAMIAALIGLLLAESWVGASGRLRAGQAGRRASAGVGR